MHNKKPKIYLFIYFIMFFYLFSSTVYANEGKAVKDTNILNPGFWQHNMKDGNKVILNQTGIAALNKKSFTDLKDILFDLNTYPSSLSKDTLKKLLEGQAFPTSDRYLNGEKVGQEYYENLKKEININGVQDTNEVKYAITVHRTNIRTLPVNDALLSEPNDIEFDMLQETEVQPVEPALVLYESLDKSWSFVQIYNYRGWMLTEDLAIANNKATWQNYLDSKKFIIVTANSLRLGYNPFSPEISEIEYDMGVKIPLVSGAEIPKLVDNQSTYGNYVIKVPVRTSEGKLGFKLALIPPTADVSVGYLPYTRENIIDQSFKSLGERYAWGGVFNAKDCSSFVLNTYKCFGILLPRNTGEQEKLKVKTVKFEETMSQTDRYKLLNTLKPGAALNMKGHTMIYLGEYKGKYYVIQDIYNAGDINSKKPDGTLNTYIINQVTVSDLSLYRKNGKQFIDNLISGKQFE